MMRRKTSIAMLWLVIMLLFACAVHGGAELQTP